MKLANPIRLTAVLCVAATSIYIMYMGRRLTDILASPEWCGKALQAEKISSQNFGGLTACVDLLKIQLNALARADLVYAGVIGLCLLVLVVIVIAGAKLELKASETGVDMNVSRDAPKAAQAVADSAQTTADVIKDAAP